MATLNGGINGAFSGKVGPVVGYKYRGKSCMKALPTKPTYTCNSAIDL